jgi:hypothetical protein
VRRLRPTETIDLECLSPIVWRGCGAAPAFVFDVDRAAGGFACFALKIETRGESPTIKFDQGGGFSDLAALSFKSFPLAFYHLPVERIPAGARMMFVPCSRPETFRFVAFKTSNAILVAVLHYLFNLRYHEDCDRRSRIAGNDVALGRDKDEREAHLQVLPRRLGRSRAARSGGQRDLGEAQARHVAEGDRCRDARERADDGAIYAADLLRLADLRHIARISAGSR